ncbi:MAG: 3-keto-5-aminohexanoate cleavage protein [Halobacteriales archaeon]|nr:3-keto-5-aminohexanoate cleavage protein [Halobacteriales archaeon]
MIQSNQQVVETVADITRSLGREVATPAQARDRLGLPDRSR